MQQNILSDALNSWHIVNAVESLASINLFASDILYYILLQITVERDTRLFNNDV